MWCVSTRYFPPEQNRTKKKGKVYFIWNNHFYQRCFSGLSPPPTPFEHNNIRASVGGEKHHTCPPSPSRCYPPAAHFLTCIWALEEKHFSPRVIWACVHKKLYSHTAAPTNQVKFSSRFISFQLYTTDANFSAASLVLICILAHYSLRVCGRR